MINKCDVIVFVNKPSKINVQNYKQYGWIKRKIKFNKKLNVKINNVEDLVIVGSFAFKNKEIFTNSFKEMIKNIGLIMNMDILVKYSKNLNMMLNIFK